jgi:hypothetical protein
MFTLILTRLKLENVHVWEFFLQPTLEEDLISYDTAYFYVLFAQKAYSESI